MSPGPEKSHKERSEGPVHFSLAAWLKLRHGLRGRRQGEQRMPIQGARGFPGRRPDLCGRRNSGLVDFHNRSRFQELRDPSPHQAPSPARR